MSRSRFLDELTPWGGRLAPLHLLATAAGAALVAVGWWGGSGSSRPATQLSWLMLAAAGAVVAGLGHAVFLLDAQRRVTACRRSLIGTLPASLSVRLPSAGAIAAGDTTVVAVPGARRYHRTGCHLVTGKPVVVVRGAEDGLSPCEVCGS